VRNAFISKGHDAVSCDILPSRSEGPHMNRNVMSLPAGLLKKFDLIIAHPPCTAIAVSGNRWYAGTKARSDAVEMVRVIWNWPVEKLCIENPVGVLNTMCSELPRPQYIQPWMFGHGETKKTGLWTRGLPPLEPTNYVEGREQRVWRMAPSETRQRDRSVTFQGIADAMAEQWGEE